ncbi:sensor histidine kinase [Paenibacillus pinihumi]|uniref:sensor histidine kinase n=1 Tax=Paenibacillus pinihumi TaxID=669462 RepID=UPI000686A575|nr:sensor histidine kinase [Paenibacillus pinihumi]
MRRKWFSLTGISLRKKSVAIFVLLVTLPSVLVGYAFLDRYEIILRQQFIDSTEKNLNTIEMNLYEKIKTVDDITDYMIYQEDFRSFMQTPETAETLDQLNADRVSIEGFVGFQLMSRNYIKSITLQGNNGNTLQLGEPVEGPEQEWIEHAKASKGAIVWSNAYPLVSAWTGPKRVISLFRVINSYYDLTKSVGMVIIRLNEAEISSLLTAAVPEEKGSIFILRPDGTVLLHSDNELVGKPYPNDGLLGVVQRNPGEIKEMDIGGSEYVVFSKRMRATGWNVVSLVKEETIVAKTNALKVSLQVLFWLVCLFGLLALIGFELAIIRPMLELKKQTSRLSTGNFSAHVTVRSRDEIGELGRQFNRMVQTIKELIDKKYKLEIRQKESELRFLQSQMDPHFLYNTLDIIRWTARLEKAPETSRLIESLSGFLRMSMNRDKQTTTLEDELEFVRSYLNLQTKRLGSNLTFSLFVDVSLKDSVLPRRLIQPLVENSIKHGLHPRQKGEIRVRCYRSDADELIIDVRDTGTGFSEEKLRAIQAVINKQSSDEALVGHAIFNINELITLSFGSGYGVEFPAEYNKDGACVRLRVPVTRNRQEAI